MPCEWLEGPNGSTIHIHTSAPRKKLCKFCGQKSNKMKMCDVPVGNGKTCDAEMCIECSRTLGYQNTDIGHGMKRLNDTIDVCPIHRGKVKVEGGKLVVME